jgi:hypothetical protein
MRLQGALEGCKAHILQQDESAIAGIAIQTHARKNLSFISLVLRAYLQPPISTGGWKYLLTHADPHRNFDGELMAFGTISGQDMERIIKRLVSFGYVGPDEGDKSNIVV